MSPRHEVTLSHKINVLRFLAVDNLPLQAAADEVGLNYDAVFDIARHHGYPDTDKMMWAIEHLQDRVDTPERDIPTPKPPRPTLSVAQNTFTPAPPTPTRVSPELAATDELLRQAAESGQARTRNLGTKISALLADLTARLQDESAEREAREKAAAEKAERDEKIAQLEAELARLKGRPLPKGTAKNLPKGAVKRNQPRGEYPCSTCDRVLDTPQGKAAHQRRAHEGFSPLAAHREQSA